MTSSSSRQRAVDADAVARQPTDDVNGAVPYGSLRLGDDDDIGEDNNNLELQHRPRFTAQASPRCISHLR